MWWWAVAWGSPAAGYAFEEVDGGVVFDAVGAAHGCLDGPVGRIDGLHGAGLAFDGVGALVAAMTTRPDVTVAAQVRSLGDGLLWRTGDLVVAVRDGRLRIEGLAELDGGVLDDDWHHVAVGSGSGVVKVFVDGVEVASGGASGALGAELRVGSQTDGTDAWQGDLDDLTVTDAFPEVSVVVAAMEVSGGRTDAVDCGDYDGDGLDDAVELDLGTDPEALDTDGDSFPDGLELGDPSIPVDTDGDGWIDAVDDDDDGDGLPSLDERVADATGDGSPDLDADGDGLENGVDLDSDADGIPDAEEGLSDSDQDGIADFLDTVDDPLPEPTTTATTGEAPAPAGNADEKGCGCTTKAASPWWGLAALWLVGSRRRSTRAGSCRR